MSDKKEKISAIKGMNDILPADAPLWELFENTAESVLKSYGYQKIVTPIVEETGLFARAIGAVTDIVEKEMYSFTDSMNGDLLTLRPEGTAGVVRAVVEHNLAYDGPKRLWYKGPMFRHERPQRGRYPSSSSSGRKRSASRDRTSTLNSSCCAAACGTTWAWTGSAWNSIRSATRKSASATAPS